MKKLLLVSVLAAALLGLLAAPAFASPKTFTVQPSGGNDTPTSRRPSSRRQGRPGQHRTAQRRPLLHQHHRRDGTSTAPSGAPARARP